jgi:hypothetical protein
MARTVPSHRYVDDRIPVVIEMSRLVRPTSPTDVADRSSPNRICRRHRLRVVDRGTDRIYRRRRFAKLMRTCNRLDGKMCWSDTDTCLCCCTCVCTACMCVLSSGFAVQSIGPCAWHVTMPRRSCVCDAILCMCVSVDRHVAARNAMLIESAN